MPKHLITMTAATALAACAAGTPLGADQSFSAPLAANQKPPAESSMSAGRIPTSAISQEREIRALVPAGLVCDVVTAQTTHGLRITPIIRSDHDISGQYSLVVTNIGAGGSSDITQGGPFDAARNVKQALGSAEISLGRGASFRAVLKVSLAGREVCRREIRS